MSTSLTSSASVQRSSSELLDLLTSLINAENCIQLRSDLAHYISVTLLQLQKAIGKQYNERLESAQSQLRDKLLQIRAMSVYSPAAAQHRFTIHQFQGLEELWLYQCPPSTVMGIYFLRKCLVRLIIEYSGVADLAEVLVPCKFSLRRGMQPMILTEQTPPPPNKYCWQFLTSLQVTHCGLVRIDEALHFFPNLVHLDLSHNSILHIAHLQDCIRLQTINLSYNRIRVLSNLERVLGKVKNLNLAHNDIESLDGVDKVYSLEVLDVRANRIADMVEVHHLGRLPCLECLVLHKNPIADMPHYRLRVFGLFIQVGAIMSGNRAFPVLDRFPISHIELRQLRKLMFRSPVNDLAESTYEDVSQGAIDFSGFDFSEGAGDADGEEASWGESEPEDGGRPNYDVLAGAAYPEARNARNASRHTSRAGSVARSSRYSVSSVRDRGGKRLSIESRVARFSNAFSDALPQRRSIDSSALLRKSPMKVKPCAREKPVAVIMEADERAAFPSLHEVQAKMDAMVQEYGAYFLVDPAAAVQARRMGLPPPSLEDPPGTGSRPLTPTRSLLPHTSSGSATPIRQNSTGRQDSVSALASALSNLDASAPASPLPREGGQRMDQIFGGKVGDHPEFRTFSAEPPTTRSADAVEEGKAFPVVSPSFSSSLGSSFAPSSSLVSVDHPAAATLRIAIAKPLSDERSSAVDLAESAAGSSSTGHSFLPAAGETRSSESRAAVGAGYVGDPQYRDLVVADNLELYFREQVFARSRPHFPRFHLRSPQGGNSFGDDAFLPPFEQDERMVCIYVEKMVELSDQDGAGAGVYAAALSPSRPLKRGQSLKRNDRGEEGYEEDDEVPVKETVVCLVLTDVGLYILDHGAITSKPLLFADAPVFTIMKAHPLYTLGGLTIFFGFQRFSLVFMDNPGVQTLGRRSIYLVLTRDKARTYPMITKIPQVANAQRASHSLLKLTNVKIENKDGQLLEQVLRYIHSTGKAQDDIVHYQMVYQIVKEKEKERTHVRLPRTIIVTQSSIILCAENLMTNSVELHVIDSYHLKDIQQIFAEENALFLTVMFRRTNMLAKRRKWRFCTDARNPSSKLLEECKRACAEVGNDSV